MKKRIKRRPNTGATVEEKKKCAELQVRYGITYAEFASMLVAQGGVCACCGNEKASSKRDWCVDHEHTNAEYLDNMGGKTSRTVFRHGVARVRGLVCLPCNTQLGIIESGRMSMLISYLRRNGTKVPV